MPSQSDAQAVLATSDSVGSIRHSSVRFFSGTVLSRISGMLRDIVLAFCFGTNEALAAFFVAFRLAHLARRLFGEGALQSAFIPLFEEIRKEDHVQGCRFFRDLSVLWAILLTVLCGLCATTLFMWRLFLSPEGGAAEILMLTTIMLPTLIPTCLFGLNISFLQCQKQYFTAAVAPVFFNVVFMGAAILYPATGQKR
jgi:putative peptidoglycan lipid II flippase